MSKKTWVSYSDFQHIQVGMYLFYCSFTTLFRKTRSEWTLNLSEIVQIVM